MSALLLCCGLACVGSVRAQTKVPDHIVRMEWQHSQEGLRETYLDRQGRPKDGMLVPRLIVFDDEGLLLGGQTGFRTGDMRGMRKLVREGRPYRLAPGLKDAREEAMTRDGKPAIDADLPAADIYVLLYRSNDCERCDRLDDELTRVIARMRGTRFVWIDVDSDPGDIEPGPERMP